MAEYASKGVAGTALGLGIAGTVGLVNQLSGCNGGVLGGILGGNCCNRGVGGLAEAQYISDLQAKVQGLEAERLANANMVAAFNQSVANDKELRTEMYAFIKPLSEESANNRVTIARLEEQIKCAGEKAELREQVIQGQLREQGLALNGKIDQVASAAKCCCEANSAAIASLQALVGKITQTNVPLSAICPEAMPRYNSWTAPTTTTPTQS
jgi:hypothetical protein